MNSRKRLRVVACLVLLGTGSVLFLPPAKSNDLATIAPLAVTAILPGHAIANAGAQPPPPAAGMDVDGLLRNAFQFVLTTIGAALIASFFTNYNRVSDVTFQSISKDLASINNRLDKFNNRLEKLEDNVVTKTNVLMTIVTLCVCHCSFQHVCAPTVCQVVDARQHLLLR